MVWDEGVDFWQDESADGQDLAEGTARDKTATHRYRSKGLVNHLAALLVDLRGQSKISVSLFHRLREGAPSVEIAHNKLAGQIKSIIGPCNLAALFCLDTGDEELNYTEEHLIRKAGGTTTLTGEP